jgi:hypothetical protein
MAIAPATDVQIPGKAVSDAEDVGAPVELLLQDLYLLGKPGDADKAQGVASVITGPPQSIALIEAGATAATKWWSAGLGATVVVAWAKTWQWWGTQPVGLKAAVVGSASLVTAAVAVAISYLFASDIRGRAEAAVATIHARAQVAMKMIQAAQDAHEPESAAGVQFAPLSPPIVVRNTLEESGNEDGWLAIATEREAGGKLKYVVVKEATTVVVEVSKLRFVW